MRTITPEEAKALRKILLTHTATSLYPDCQDPDFKNSLVL